MASTLIQAPFNTYTDVDGDPLEDGYIYIGADSVDPEANPIAVFWDAAMTIPATQPIRTKGGYPNNAGAPEKIFAGVAEYSIRVKNKNSTTVNSDLNATGISYAGIIDNFTHAIPNDGVTNASAALIAAEQEAFTTGKILVLAGTYLLDADIQFRRQFITNGSVTFKAIAAGDTVPTKNVNISRKMEVTGVTFDYVNVIVAPPDSNQLVMMTTLSRNSFINSPLFCGQLLTPTFGITITDNDFVWGLSRLADAVTFTNVSVSRISDNRMQSYRCGVKLIVSRSFASDGNTIIDNEMTNCFEGIRAEGSSMFRFTNLGIVANTISGSARDATNINVGAIVITWAVGLSVLRNTVTSNSDVLKIQACLDTMIAYNYLDSTGNQGACLRASGCSGGKLLNNSLRSNSGFLVLVGSAAVNPITTGNVYSARNWQVWDNEGLCNSLGFSFADCESADVLRNKITSRTAAPSGLIRFSATCTGRYYDNLLIAPSGVGVSNLAGGNVTNAVNTDLLVVGAITPPTIAAPIITASDPALDNAKSYVVTFTLTHYSQLRQLASDTAPMTLSGWMGTVTGETLGWNSSPWDTSNNNRLGDIVVNGITYDNFGTEDWWFARSSLLLDRQNRLTCRNWATTAATSQNVPVGVSARQIDEQAWQTVAFRPPLVVDGAIYDPVPSGLTTFTDYAVTISGRMSLGQKSDGTYVLLAVDGATGVSGTTSAKVAAKLLALGCQNAFMLDGGGSATLWYMGAVINTPSDPGGERIIPAAMYV